MMSLFNEIDIFSKLVVIFSKEHVAQLHWAADGWLKHKLVQESPSDIILGSRFILSDMISIYYYIY